MAKTKYVYDKERVICGETFYTLWGMSEQVPGRTKGSHITPNTLLQYVKEGCPCFEHCGALYFKKDLSEFTAWLTTRRPQRQIKALERRARYDRYA